MQQTVKLTAYKTKNKATTFYKKNHNKISAVNYSTGYTKIYDRSMQVCYQCALPDT